MALSLIINDEGGIFSDVGYNSTSEFFLKDHPGNVRVAFRPGENGIFVQQVDSYYPFGFNQKGLTLANTDYVHANEYLYNGKMMQDELGLNWLDYGARFYDAVLGRWHSVDPLAEKYQGQSPFVYCANIPMRFIDSDGKLIDDYYVTNSNGKTSYDHSDECKGDGNVYLDGVLLPSYADRAFLHDKIAAHLSHGPTISVIGGRKVPIVEYDPNNPIESAENKEVLIDATNHTDLTPGAAFASVDINSGDYTPPAGFSCDIQPLLWDWHLHINGGFIPVPDDSNNGFIVADHSLAEMIPGSTPTATGPIIPDDLAPHPNTFSYTFEPKINTVYILDNFGIRSQSDFNWFFSVQEGSHP